MRLGYHVPVAGGLVHAARQAHEIGCQCLQLFPRNARGWRGRAYSEAEVEAFRRERERFDLGPLVLHSNYLCNLAASKQALLARSREVVADDLQRAHRLGAQFLVTHPGHPVGESVEIGLERLGESVRLLLRDLPEGVRFLLENTAGGEGQLGGRWEHFARVFAEVDHDPRVGVCFDTCHAHAAGYSLDSPRRVSAVLREFDRIVGLDRISVIHLNDCQGESGGHRDRHEHIGKGTIGDAGFRALLRRRELQDRCVILETPIREKEDDARNLARVRELVGIRDSGLGARERPGGRASRGGEVGRAIKETVSQEKEEGEG